MKKGRFSEEQIIGILKQHEAGRKLIHLQAEIDALFIVIQKRRHVSEA